MSIGSKSRKTRPFLRRWPMESPRNGHVTWWRHQMETFSALLAICAENSPVPGEFTAQRPVTRSFDVFFDLRLNKRLSKQLWGWWFETLSHPLWRHRNDVDMHDDVIQWRGSLMFYLMWACTNAISTHILSKWHSNVTADIIKFHDLPSGKMGTICTYAMIFIS